MTDPSVPGEHSEKQPGLFRRYKRAVLILIGIPLILQMAVFVHNFLVFGAKARQAEARQALSAIYRLEKEFFEKHERYGTFDEIGFTPSDFNRYTYRIDSSGKPGTIIPPCNGSWNKSAQPRVSTITCGGGDHKSPAPDNSLFAASLSSSGFTATATANIDSDPTIDQWHVTDQEQGLQQADVSDVPYGWEWIFTLVTFDSR